MNKRLKTIQIMVDNPDKSMSEVAKMISEECDMPLNQARAYYVWAVRSDHAPGAIVLEKRGRKLGSKLVRKTNEPDTDTSDETSNETTDGICYDTFNTIMKDVLDEVKIEPQQQQQAV